MSIPNWTHEDITKGYVDGMLPSSDARLVLLGYEGSGKTCLADTLVGKSFQDTPPTEGADQLEISITMAANWEVMNKAEKLDDLEKQALLEAQFFLSSNSESSNAKSNTTFLSLSTTEKQTTDDEQEVKSDNKVDVGSGKSKTPPTDKRFVPISPEEFQHLKALQEEYDPEKKYIHLWDFAGQQVSGGIPHKGRIQSF